MKRIVSLILGIITILSMSLICFAYVPYGLRLNGMDGYWVAYDMYKNSELYSVEQKSGISYHDEGQDYSWLNGSVYLTLNSEYAQSEQFPNVYIFPQSIHTGPSDFKHYYVYSVEDIYLDDQTKGQGLETFIIDSGIGGLINCDFTNFTNLKNIVLPNTLKYIDNVQANSSTTFYVQANSFAERYCVKNNLNYKVYSSYNADDDKLNIELLESLEPSIQSSPITVTSFGATVSDWAAPEIEEAFENNLIPEVMLDFDLTKKVNRGEFAAIAVQLYEVLAKRNVEESLSCTFTDIQHDDNEKAIKKAYQIEVAQGTSTTTYEPLSFINREQLATMLCRVIKKYSYPNWTMENDADYYMDTTGVQKFADDVDISEWAKPSVYFMAKFGIVKGVSDTHFAPKNTTTQQEASGYASATREQAIILAQRIFKISDVFGN